MSPNSNDIRSYLVWTDNLYQTSSVIDSPKYTLMRFLMHQRWYWLKFEIRNTCKIYNFRLRLISVDVCWYPSLETSQTEKIRQSKFHNYRPLSTNLLIYTSGWIHWRSSMVQSSWLILTSTSRYYKLKLLLTIFSMVTGSLRSL